MDADVASNLLAVVSQSLATLPDWARRFQLTRLYVLMSIYRSAARLVGTGSVVLVDQTTDDQMTTNDQIRNDTGNIPSTLWRSAILRGHGTGVTQRPSPATRTWWWWWWWCGERWTDLARDLDANLIKYLTDDSVLFFLISRLIKNVVQRVIDWQQMSRTVM